MAKQVSFTTALFFALTLFSAGTQSRAQANEGPTIQLTPGKSREIDLGRAPQSILLANPDLATIERVGLTNKIRITPRGRGATAVHIQYPDGRETTFPVQIGNGENAANSKIFPMSQSAGLRIAREITRIAGLESFVEDGKVAAAGRITSLDSFLQLQRIVHANPSTVKPSLTIPPETELQVTAAINSQLKTLGEPMLRVFITNGSVALHGTPSSEGGRQRARDHVQNMFPGLVDAMADESGEDTVLQINVRFLEVGKSARTKLGSKLAGGDAPFSAIASLENPLAPTFQIAPIGAFFNAIKESNAAREIATPTLLTRSGERATFLAGGEIPLVAERKSASNSAVSVETIQFKPYGIIFNALPQIKADGNVWLQVDAEFSHIDNSVSYGGVPGFLSRKVNTQIVLKQGETAILSGLVKAGDLKKVDKLPIVGSIPIIGELFKSRTFQEENSELWIVVWTQGGQSKKRPEDVDALYRNAEKNTQGSVLD